MLCHVLLSSSSLCLPLSFKHRHIVILEEHTHTHTHDHVIFNDYQVENVNKAFSISLITQ